MGTAPAPSTTRFVVQSRVGDLMTPRLHFALVACITLGFGLGSARAAEDASPIPAPSPIEAQPEEPAIPPPAPIPPHSVGAIPVLPPVEEAQASQPSSLDRWPIEYVLRPQT